VQRLYAVVIARNPVGISKYGDHFLKRFSPYLSQKLLYRIKTTRSCENDWYTRHAGQLVKPPFAWLEFGLFSGHDDLTGLSAIHIERQEIQGDGSTYVYVRLQSKPQVYSPDFPKAPPEKTFHWQVAVHVVMEGGIWVVDDVIYLKGQWVDSESRLSEVLMTGCQGPHWVGPD
jgi:hypothetical protein